MFYFIYKDEVLYWINWTISGSTINMHKKNEVKWIEGYVRCVSLVAQLGPS